MKWRNIPKDVSVCVGGCCVLVCVTLGLFLYSIGWAAVLVDFLTQTLVNFRREREDLWFRFVYFIFKTNILLSLQRERAQITTVLNIMQKRLCKKKKIYVHRVYVSDRMRYICFSFYFVGTYIIQVQPYGSYFLLLCGDKK